MPEEKRQEEQTISQEAETAARVERERLFQSRIPRVSDQLIAARVAESTTARTLGMEPNKAPADIDDSLRTFREQLTSREPGALEQSQVPPTGE